jgi:hypothetical protein
MVDLSTLLAKTESRYQSSFFKCQYASLEQAPTAETSLFLELRDNQVGKRNDLKYFPGRFLAIWILAVYWQTNRIKS